MTGYHLQIGYQSSQDYDEAWGEMLKTVAGIRADPNLIAVEALNYGAPPSADGESIQEFAAMYQGDLDSTIRIIDKIEDGERHRQIMQLAGGSGASRTMKEHMRRAFCRLVIQAMHRKGFEVNLIVA